MIEDKKYLTSEQVYEIVNRTRLFIVSEVKKMHPDISHGNLFLAFSRVLNTHLQSHYGLVLETANEALEKFAKEMESERK